MPIYFLGLHIEIETKQKYKYAG